MSAKMIRELTESPRVLEIPPNNFGLTSISLDMNRFPFTPMEVVIVGIDPESGKEASFSIAFTQEEQDLC